MWTTSNKWLENKVNEEQVKELMKSIGFGDLLGMTTRSVSEFKSQDLSVDQEKARAQKWCIDSDTLHDFAL